MMNMIWSALCVIGICWGILNGRSQALTEAAMSAARDAIQLAVTLAGGFALWSGMLRIVEWSGAIRGVTRWLSPVLGKLFPEISKQNPALEAMAMNMAANMLGLGNAATPMGLSAMRMLSEQEAERIEAKELLSEGTPELASKEAQELLREEALVPPGGKMSEQTNAKKSERFDSVKQLSSWEKVSKTGAKKSPQAKTGANKPPQTPELRLEQKRSEVASDAICMFLVINASSLQLFPTTVIALRAAAGSVSPASVLLPTLASTAISTGVGIAACMLLSKWGRRYG